MISDKLKTIDGFAICTIYKLTNEVNGMYYIGQTWQTLKVRWHSGSGYKTCTYLDRAIEKYGKNNFSYEVLAYAYTQEQADELEDDFINIYNSRNPQKGYNIRGGGSRGQLSEEHKQKISIANTGKKATEETKKRLSVAHKNQHSSPKTEFKGGHHYSPKTEFKKGMTSPRKIYFTDVQIQDIDAERKSGKSLKSIGQKYNVDRDVISRVLRELNNATN